MRAIFGLVLLVGGVIGCAGNQKETFHPGERATAESLSGYSAAEYTLEAPTGAVGEV